MAISSTIAFSSASSQPGGVSSTQLSSPLSSASREWPSMERKASLALVMRVFSSA